jgi:cytochrome c oxidase cbb3-type subunit III
MEENTQDKKHQEKSDADEHLMDHNYDGIEELDNPPPRWIMAIFYITIAWSIIYAANYFWLDVGDDQDTEYVKKSAQHDAKYQLKNQSTGELGLLTDAADLDAGKIIYTEMNCFTCHGVVGEGNAIGPNLTDNYWISGCDFPDVVNIIKNGNPTKGMTAFKTQISDSKIQQVASYVLSLSGTDPADAKAAQGDLCD